MKVQTRSPCERTVDEKRERKKEKNRSDTPIVAPVKIVIFFYRKEGIRVEREEKKSMLIFLFDLDSTFHPKMRG